MSVLGILYGNVLYEYSVQGDYMENFSTIST